MILKPFLCSSVQLPSVGPFRCPLVLERIWNLFRYILAWRNLFSIRINWPRLIFLQVTFCQNFLILIFIETIPWIHPRNFTREILDEKTKQNQQIIVIVIISFSGIMKSIIISFRRSFRQLEVSFTLSKQNYWGKFLHFLNGENIQPVAYKSRDE